MITHLCELQIHHNEIKKSDYLLLSHVTSEFFRNFFCGNKEAVSSRLDLLLQLPVDECETVDDLVEKMIEPDDEVQTEHLIRLLESIDEYTLVVRVYEHTLLAIKERKYGPDHREVAMTLGYLALAYRQLGNPDKDCELSNRGPQRHPRPGPQFKQLEPRDGRSMRSISEAAAPVESVEEDDVDY